MNAKVISSQAAGSAMSTAEGSETRIVSSASDNRFHERPGNMCEADLGWLAGIVDGEGNVNLRHHSKGKGFSARLEIVSTSPEMLGKCVKVMKQLGVQSASVSAPRMRKRNKLAKKPVASCCLTLQEDLMLVFRSVLPHLTEKRAVVEAVVALYAPRKKGASWTDEDVTAAKAIRLTYMPRAA